MIDKFNRKPQPKEPTIDIATGEQNAPKAKPRRKYREDVPQLVLDMEQARRNAAKLSPRLMELLYPQGMPDDE